MKINALKQFRIKLGYNFQKQLAKKLNISPSIVSNWERGKHFLNISDDKKNEILKKLYKLGFDENLNPFDEIEVSEDEIYETKEVPKKEEIEISDKITEENLPEVLKEAKSLAAKQSIFAKLLKQGDMKLLIGSNKYGTTRVIYKYKNQEIYNHESINGFHFNSEEY